MVIPVQVRRRLGIEQGTRLVVLVDDDAVVLVPRAAIERRLHAIFKGVPVSMADELIEERRAEASAEADAPLTVVLDASAVLAWLQQESVGARSQRYARGGDRHRCKLVRVFP